MEEHCCRCLSEPKGFGHFELVCDWMEADLEQSLLAVGCLEDMEGIQQENLQTVAAKSSPQKGNQARRSPWRSTATCFKRMLLYRHQLCDIKSVVLLLLLLLLCFERNREVLDALALG
jgi:hypothetical protein